MDQHRVGHVRVLTWISTFYANFCQRRCCTHIQFVQLHKQKCSTYLRVNHHAHPVDIIVAVLRMVSRRLETREVDQALACRQVEGAAGRGGGEDSNMKYVC